MSREPHTFDEKAYFTGQDTPIEFQIRTGLDQSNVCRYLASLLHFDDIAGNQVGRGHLSDGTVS